MLALIGLIIIVLAWVMQLSVLIKDKKSRKISKSFILLYALGALILVYDGFMGGAIGLAIVNLLTVVLAVIILLIIKKRK
jgi:uncharacterized membrane protein YfcA